MNTSYRVAIVGAKGAEAAELLGVLESRDFPVDDMRLFAAGESEDRFQDFRGEEIPLEELCAGCFDGIDIAFFCCDADCSREHAPAAAAAGAVCIDGSPAWRMDSEVPLVVPEINPGEVDRFRDRRIIASPTAATVQIAIPLKALHDAGVVRRVVASTYQSVSSCGEAGVDELRIQSGELLNGRPSDPRVFPHQIAFNCLPQIGSLQDGGDCEGERALMEETAKVLGDGDLRVTATAVRVPVFYGDCVSVNVETANKIDATEARRLLSAFPGIEVLGDVSGGDYPMPVDSAGEDLIRVGRIREDASVANGLNLWIVSDNLRRGAAINMVQIAELLIERGLS